MTHHTPHSLGAIAAAIGPITTVLEPRRIAHAKRAFTTRNVPVERMWGLLQGRLRPCAGDLVLARVERIGFQESLHTTDHRRSMLFVGDEVVLCYGNRYAPDQLEARLPDDLGPCHVAAAGGVAGHVIAWHKELLDGPTDLVPLGLLTAEDGPVLNLCDFALPPRYDAPVPDVIVVAGTSMNGGKTRTAAALVKGLSRTGAGVAAVKITGTGAEGDFWTLGDAGALTVLDFTDAGYASTYRVPLEELVHAMEVLVSQAAAAGASVVVAEVADGLYQAETAALLRSERVHRMVNGVVFAASEAMGAGAGAAWLRGEGYPVLALSGRMCLSPLARAEARAETGVPVYTLEELELPQVAAGLLPRVVPGAWV
jgi:hypothetical protein